MRIATIDEIAADEARQLDVSTAEDMTAAHKRYRLRAGSQEAVRLASDRGMPSGNDVERWTRFQAEKTSTLTGGFDPCSLIQ